MSDSSSPASAPIRGIFFWGGKSKARILNEMLRESGIGEATMIFDPTLTEAPFPHTSFFTNDISAVRDRLHLVSHYVVCIGGEHGFARVKTAEYLERVGLQPLSIVHNRAFIEPTASVSIGCQIMPCAVVHKFAEIGKHTIINTNATIDHECTVGDGVHIMGNAAIAGKVTIGNFATIGTNATILPYLTIGEGAYIGAGAVVTKDVAPHAVVAGVPARTLRENSLQFFAKPLEELLSGIR